MCLIPSTAKMAQNSERKNDALWWVLIPQYDSFFSPVSNIRNLWEMSKHQLLCFRGGRGGVSLFIYLTDAKQEKLAHGVDASKTKTTSLAGFFFFFNK